MLRRVFCSAPLAGLFGWLTRRTLSVDDEEDLLVVRDRQDREVLRVTRDGRLLLATEPDKAAREFVKLFDFLAKHQSFGRPLELSPASNQPASMQLETDQGLVLIGDESTRSGYLSQTPPEVVLDGGDMNQDLHHLLAYAWTHGSVCEEPDFPAPHLIDLIQLFLAKHSRSVS